MPRAGAMSTLFRDVGGGRGRVRIFEWELASVRKGAMARLVVERAREGGILSPYVVYRHPSQDGVEVEGDINPCFLP